MMVIRPVERSDVSALMQLASKTGGGLTSLPANEATLSARIERAIKTLLQMVLLLLLMLVLR